MWIEFEVQPYTIFDEFGLRIMSRDGASVRTEVEIWYVDQTVFAYDSWEDEFFDCGGAAGADWHEFQVRLNFTGTYDVIVNGSSGPAPCRAVTMKYGDEKPFHSIQLIDWPNDGFGGSIWWDNFVARKPYLQ